MSELVIKEIEVGGVFNLDKYENVRVSIRVVVNDPRDIARIFDKLSILVEQTAAIQRACRRYKEMLKTIQREIEHQKRYAREEKERAETAMEHARREAEELIKKLNLDLLPKEVKAALEQDPTNAFRLGIVSTKCLYIEDYEMHIKRAEEHEKLAKELENKLAEISKLYAEMKNKLHEGKLAEAATIAEKLWNIYKELTKNTRLLLR